MWQDWYFALAGVVYSAVLIPSMRDPKTEIRRVSSVLTAVAVGVSGVAYATLGMWLASASCLYGVLTWGFLAWRRPIRSEPTHVFVLREGEEAIVLQYREYMAHQQKLAGGGCGGCPSQGGCSDEEA